MAPAPKLMVGKWVTEKDENCGITIADFCLCYSCVCYTYKGVPFSCSNIWTCGDGCFVGPCIGIKYDSEDKLEQRWLICPYESYKRAGAESAGDPASQEMARETQE